MCIMQNKVRSTCTPELLKESLLNRSVHRCTKLPLYASYHALGVSHGQPGRQLGVQRCAHGAEVAGGGRGASRDSVVTWRVAELLLLRLLRAFGYTLGCHGPGVHSLPHHHDLLLQQLPLAVLEAVELPLPLSKHLSIEWGLSEMTTEVSIYTNKQITAVVTE